MIRRPLAVVWFKRDLRATDHAALALAAATGRDVLPLWIVEPALWQLHDASGRQYEFHAECAAALRDDLAALGQPLVVRVGDAVAVLAALHRAHGIAGLFAHQETGNLWTYARDRRVRAWVRAQGIPLHEPRQNGVVRALPSRDGWARQWERFMRASCDVAPALRPLAIDAGTIPDAASLGLPPDLCPGRQTGGAPAARALLDGFLAGRGRDYRRGMSSPVTAFDQCSRLSPHFAAGSLSVRQAAQAAWAALDRGPPGMRPAVTSFLSRLAWHCHFTQKLESEPGIETRDLHPALRGLRPDGAGTEAFRRWAEGTTGWPFLDGCMRALAATGWMNFRMRAMLMSVATGHLGLDWRAPGLHLARLFTDYDAGIHWPQTQMQSGSTGVNTVRLYNPVKQGLDQDADGTFIRRWVPELARLPAPHIHTPWAAPPDALHDAGVRLDGNYPRPIGDHEALARTARATLWGARRGPAYRAAADAIQQQHGSRRSGMKQVGDRPGAARRRTPTAQGALELE